MLKRGSHTDSLNRHVGPSRANGFGAVPGAFRFEGCVSDLQPLWLADLKETRSNTKGRAQCRQHLARSGPGSLVSPSSRWWPVSWPLPHRQALRSIPRPLAPIPLRMQGLPTSPVFPPLRSMPSIASLITESPPEPPLPRSIRLRDVERWQMALFLTRQAEVHGLTLPSGADQGFTDLAGVPAAAVTAINQTRTARDFDWNERYHVRSVREC